MTPLAALLMLAVLPQGTPGNQSQPPTPLPVPRAVAGPRGDRAIQVDGSLLDWPSLPPLDLSDQRQLSGTAYGAWRERPDLSGAMFLLWDAEDLYIAASVQDEWHRALDVQTMQLIEIPPADSIVLTFDPDRNTRSLGPDQGRSEDAEFWLAEEASNQLVRWDRLRGTARPVESGRQVVSHDKERGITTYEARIPWREILPVGRAAEAGLVFDLQVVINDFDESTDPMPQTRIGWTFGCGPRIDPGLLGSVMLVRDLAGMDRMPEFPPRVPIKGEPIPAAPYWDDLAVRLGKLPPGLFVGEGAPEATGGLDRFAVLEELEEHCARFPRVDYLEFNQRVHRRMTREVAGAVERGLPCFWYRETQRMAQRAEQAVPDGILRIFRLPQGGWLFRSNQRNFAVDPAGPDLAHFLWGGMEFVLLTQPLDMTRRNDQLLLRMAAAEPARPFLSHVAFHLPVVKMADLEMVEPGKSYGQAGGTQVSTLGQPMPDGSVPYSLGYFVEAPGGKRVLIVGPSVRAVDLPEGPCDVCILSPRNPDAAAIGRAAKAGLYVIDDVLSCETFPRIPRIRLADGFELQRKLLPSPSVILAPGESWDIR